MDLTEEWRVVPGFEYLEASSLGNIRRCQPGRVHNAVVGHVFAQSNPSGDQYYRAIRVGTNPRRRFNVHRLVCLAFHGEAPPRAHAAHKDGNSLNNRADNLHWVTCKENMEDKAKHGTSYQGSAHHFAKLRESDIPIIRRRLCSGDRLCDIARDYKVNPVTIADVRKGRIWKQVP